MSYNKHHIVYIYKFKNIELNKNTLILQNETF